METPAKQNFDDGSFIIQNITRGPLCINDGTPSGLSLNIEPLYYQDLTSEDYRRIKNSSGLTKALINGLVIRITRAQAEDIERRRIHAEEARRKRVQQRQNKQVDIVMDAEFIDVNAARAFPDGGEVEAMNTANDPISYAKALNVYISEIEASQGRIATAEEFARITERDPGIIHQLLTGDENSTMTPGAHSSPYVAGMDSHGRMSPQKAHADRVAAELLDMFPPSNDPIYSDDEGIAEEFDLIKDLHQNPGTDMH